jgi:hypothetical protein
VPVTPRNLKEPLEDVDSNFDGAPDLEFRHATNALELETTSLVTIEADLASESAHARAR